MLVKAGHGKHAVKPVTLEKLPTGAADRISTPSGQTKVTLQETIKRYSREVTWTCNTRGLILEGAKRARLPQYSQASRCSTKARRLGSDPGSDLTF